MPKIVVLSFIILFSLISFQLYTNAGGPTYGVAGEPPLNETCNVGGCHTGSPLNSGGGSTAILCLDSLGNIVTSYIPNHTYTIKLRVSEGTKTRYGFEAIVLRGIGTNSTAVGTMIITSPDSTQLFGPANRKNIMHKLGGIDFATNNGTWQFNWKAPTGNFGTATVYAAFNATNHSSSNSGDEIYTKTLSIAGTGTSGIPAESNATILSFFPNTVASSLQLNFLDNATIKVYNLHGDILKSLTVAPNPTIDVGDLNPGIYLLKIISSKETITFRFVKI